MVQYTHTGKINKGILTLLGGVFLVVLYRTAWISDDAYITYRSLENFVTGYGFTFNPGQRVQAYTHPLWAFLHIPFRVVFSNMYIIGLFVSMATSIVAMVFLLRNSTKEIETRIFLLVALISSAAFIDYSTSGLENPLTNLLLVGTVTFYLSEKPHPRRLLILSFFAGLMLLNRMDSILLVGPMLFVTWWQQKSIGATFMVLLGLSPFIIWEICATIYYGFPFPMTAYAKLNTSVGRTELWIQGWHYFENLFANDFLTGLIILAGCVVPFFRNQKKMYPIVGGVCLYLLYILYIGGGFMQGRFFCAPFFLALIVLGYLLPPKLVWYVAPAALLIGLLGTFPPVLSHAELGSEQQKETFIGRHNIANERVFYFPISGLIAAKGKALPNGKWVETGKKARISSQKMFGAGNMGFIGYFAGPQKHIIDWYALTDPFLAQLPNIYTANWRPGHNQRLIPRGYGLTFDKGENELLSPELRKVWVAINQITRGPIWDAQRFQTMWEMNFTDTYSRLIDKKFYTLPLATSIPEKDLNTFSQTGMLAHADAGFEILLEPNKKLHLLEVWLQNDCSYSCVFRNGEKIVEGKLLNKTVTDKDLTKFVIPAPLEKITNIVIFPTTSSHSCQIRDIRLEY